MYVLHQARLRRVYNFTSLMQRKAPQVLGVLWLDQIKNNCELYSTPVTVPDSVVPTKEPSFPKSNNDYKQSLKKVMYKNKKVTSPPRVELGIFRLTVGRLNHLAMENT